MCKCFYCTFGTSASIEYLITVLLLHIWCKFFYCIKCANCTFGSSVAIALNVQVFLLQRPHHPSSPFPSDCTRLATFIRDQNHQNTPTSVLSSKLSQFFDTFSRLTQILYIRRIYQLSSERRDVTNFNFFHFQVHHTTPSTPQYTLVHPSLLKNERWQKIDLYSARPKCGFESPLRRIELSWAAGKLPHFRSRLVRDISRWQENRISPIPRLNICHPPCILTLTSPNMQLWWWYDHLCDRWK